MRYLHDEELHNFIFTYYQNNIMKEGEIGGIHSTNERDDKLYRTSTKKTQGTIPEQEKIGG